MARLISSRRWDPIWAQSYYFWQIWLVLISPFSHKRLGFEVLLTVSRRCASLSTLSGLNGNKPLVVKPALTFFGVNALSLARL